MVITKIGKRTYYSRKDEVEKVRRKGDRIFFSKTNKAYYIRRL